MGIIGMEWETGLIAVFRRCQVKITKNIEIKHHKKDGEVFKQKGKAKVLSSPLYRRHDHLKIISRITHQ